jgi:hypothetical protein
MDWTVATFLDRLLHGLWFDPDQVRDRYDVGAIRKRQRRLTEVLVREWREVAPGADAAVIEFEFQATGNAKRKLLRRLEGDGPISKWRGGFSCRSAMPFQWLEDYAIAYDIVATDCGGALVKWRVVASPLRD